MQAEKPMWEPCRSCRAATTPRTSNFVAVSQLVKQETTLHISASALLPGQVKRDL
jgi:hypothetical protein